MSINKFSNLFPKFKEKLGNRALFDVPLAPYLAYRVGGPADILVFPKTEEELQWTHKMATQHQIPLTIIGTGTNLLVLDGGIRGITISLAQAFQEITLLSPPKNGKIWVQCGGGVMKPSLLNWACEQGYTGLEFSSGVPGTVGGGIYMNAGTKYGCYGDILKELRLFDFKTGFKQLKRDEVHFSYRESAVRDSIVIWAAFELSLGDKPNYSREG
jgi:UDP-N-acetylmuramate dehydrogenase